MYITNIYIYIHNNTIQYKDDNDNNNNHNDNHHDDNNTTTTTTNNNNNIHTKHTRFVPEATGGHGRPGASEETQ